MSDCNTPVLDSDTSLQLCSVHLCLHLCLCRITKTLLTKKLLRHAEILPGRYYSSDTDPGCCKCRPAIVRMFGSVDKQVLYYFLEHGENCPTTAACQYLQAVACHMCTYSTTLVYSYCLHTRAMHARSIIMPWCSTVRIYSWDRTLLTLCWFGIGVLGPVSEALQPIFKNS